MALINLSIKHGRTLDEARASLDQAVREVQARFGTLIRTVNWSGDRTAVTIAGVGFHVEMRVDPTDVHVTGDMPFLGNLLGGPFVSGLKAIVRQRFQQLAPPPKA